MLHPCHIVNVLIQMKKKNKGNCGSSRKFETIQADQIHTNSTGTAGNVQGNYLKWVFTSVECLIASEQDHKKIHMN